MYFSEKYLPLTWVINLIGMTCVGMARVLWTMIQTTKEEVLECKDGYDGPNYWELFAQFYYSGITMPAYCRPYARPNHPFKTPGMLCLSEKGVWEKQ